MNAFKKFRAWLGWCPNAEILNEKREVYMVPYVAIDKIGGIGFRGFLAILHLVFAAWLILTALWVLAKSAIFPWWILDINIISSGILLLVGVSSLMIFFNFRKTANIHRILALVNSALLILFFLYLSQFQVSFETGNSLFDKPYNNYVFGFWTLILFTLIAGMPSILAFFSKPAGEKKKGFLKATLLILIIIFASIGAYYLYLNKQKNTMLVEESGENGKYKLYKVEPVSTLYGTYSYFLDSAGDTTGHHISKDTYEAIQFLRNKGDGRVLAWWDFELEIKAADKEPVISYASDAIKTTIARPASLYDKYEPNEKVADVSRFFATDSEDIAKSIAEKYGATIIYISKQRMSNLFPVMFMAANSGFNIQSNPVAQSPKSFEKRFYEPSMAYKFNSGAEMKYFEKIFENKDVYIYKLKQ